MLLLITGTHVEVAQRGQGDTRDLEALPTVKQ